MNTNTNINQIILELNKAEQMLADRQISAKNNLGKLVKSGAIRNRNTMNKGIEKGTLRSIYDKKYGSQYKVKNVDIWNASTTQPKDKILNIPKFNKKSIINSIARRHEANEAKESELISKRYFHGMPTKGYHFEKDGKLVGLHASPQVLKNEKKIVDYTSLFDKNVNAYRNKKIKNGEYGSNGAGLSSKKIEKYRKNSIPHEITPDDIANDKKLIHYYNRNRQISNILDNLNDKIIANRQKRVFKYYQDPDVSKMIAKQQIKQSLGHKNSYYLDKSHDRNKKLNQLRDSIPEQRKKSNNRTIIL